MAYNWQNGELITAEKLNQTGDELSDTLIVNVTGSNGTTIFDKTYQEIFDAAENEKPILFKDAFGIHNAAIEMPSEGDEDEGHARIGYYTFFWHLSGLTMSVDIDSAMLTVNNVVLKASYSYNIVTPQE